MGAAIVLVLFILLVIILVAANGGSRYGSSFEGSHLISSFPRTRLDLPGLS
ncbi:hypothetical protein VQL36_02875 [Chengkuizengella sp. SCS-71B]|uniref:hypothetical protein n=1 Tax=Chengkuizengella sp. SCS-71B TaxID=3115290 RepID=UPI0032C22BE0